MIRTLGGRRYKVEKSRIFKVGYEPWDFYALKEFSASERIGPVGDVLGLNRPAWRVVGRYSTAREAWRVARKVAYYRTR